MRNKWGRNRGDGSAKGKTSEEAENNQKGKNNQCLDATYSNVSSSQSKWQYQQKKCC